jgi:rhomboid protease GluP
VLTAAAGSAASYIVSPGVNGVGASGAIFGLFGMLLVSDRVHRPALTRSARGLTGQIGMLIALNLVLGFTIPNIDNAAHIGGLLAGAWLGFVLVPRGATLSGLWQPPGTQAAAPTVGLPDASGAGDDARVGRDTILRLAGVVALVAIIVLAVGLGPLGRS